MPEPREPWRPTPEEIARLERLFPLEILMLIDLRIYMAMLALIRLWKSRHPEE